MNNTRSFLFLTLLLLLASCAPSPVQDTAVAPARVPRLQEAANLLPYIEEAQAEMRGNYQEAVELLDAMRGEEALEKQYKLLQAYVESLSEGLKEMDRFVVLAKERTLTDEEANAYRKLRADWRMRSELTFGAMGRE